jgi:protein tyrosine/serine phosphatase
MLVADAGRFARRLEGALGVPYAAEVEPGLLRGGQPDDEGLDWLKSQGVRTILNLRHFHGVGEREQVEAAGLRFEWVPLASSEPPSDEQLSRILELLRDISLRTLYVHCEHGVDRTGAIMAVWRMEHGWSNAEAYAEMEYFGAHALWIDLHHFVHAYVPKNR